MTTIAERVEERDDQGEERDDQAGISIGSRQILTASPLIWILLAAAVAWAVWATVTRGTSSGSASGTRAVVVPTAGADRLVVALPCSSSGSQGGSTRPHAGGSVVVPRDSGDRVVLVPGCKGGGSGGAGGGGASGGSEPPGSPIVQVLAPGAPIPMQGSKAPSPSGGSGGGQGKIRNVFRVPSTDASKVILVTPCTGGKSGSGGGGQQPRTPPPSGRGLLVAPPCSGGR